MARGYQGASPEWAEDESLRLSRRGLGLLLIFTACFLALALVTYNGADPSFNRATSQNIQNIAGVPGAYIADMALQIVGVASAFFVLLCLSWGWKMLRGRPVLWKSLRITALMGALITGSTFFSFISAPIIWPIETGLGGAVGALMHDRLLQVLNGWVMMGVSLLATLSMLPFALALSLDECGFIGRVITRGIVGFFSLLGLRFRSGLIDYSGATSERFGWFRNLFVRGAGEDEDEEESAPRRRAPRAKKVVDREEKAPTKSKGAQPSFELKSKHGKYQMPPMSMLAAVPKSRKSSHNEQSLTQNARMLESVLQDFGVSGEVSKIRPGPVVTLYELEPSPGTKSSRVIGLADDISRSMSATSTRIAVIPGRNAIGIELPNANRETVYLRELLEDDEFRNTDAKLPLAMGKDIGGAPIIVDLAKMPHLLVAGTTGSGKSVAINTMIMSLIYFHSPETCKFIMIDPKMLELSIYDDIPHLLSPVVTEPGKAVVALKWTVKEMENRYRLMSNLGVRNIEGYNKRIYEAKAKGEVLQRTVQTGFDPESGEPIIEEVALDMTPLPFIVVVVDEMADLMLVAGKDIETSVQRLAQMARAAGIHIIMATQRPSVDVITGVIKANFPTRVSFQVTSRIDSRTILGEQGAEQLLGQGDMLYMAGGGRITRVHGPFISDKEVTEIVSHLKAQGSPTYIEDITIDEGETAMLEGMDGGDEDDGLYQQAVTIVMRDRRASTSYIQRHLKIGYNRAARIIERMEKEGIVGTANHVGKREVLSR